MDLAEVYSGSKSEEDFYMLLKQKSYVLYKRYGRYYGISGKRKARFSTHGYPIEKIKLLDRNIERHKRLEHIIELQKKRERDRKRKR